METLILDLSMEYCVQFLFLRLNVDANVSFSMSRMVTSAIWGRAVKSPWTHTCLPQWSRIIDGGWGEGRRGAGTG